MSNDALHAKVLTFLLEELKRSGGRQCVKIELAHAQQGFRADTVSTWDREDDPALFEDLARVEALAAGIISKAEEEADSFGNGTHRFVIKTTQHLGGRGRCSFQLAAAFIPGDETQLALAGENAPAGRSSGGGTDLLPALSLQMRHNVHLMNINGEMFQGSLQVLAQTNKGLREELSAANQTIKDLTSQLHAANDRKDERDMAAMKQIAADQRKEKVIAKVLPLIPVAASKFLTGGKDASAADKQSAVQILITELAGSLTPSQIAQLARPLSAPQQILFMELMRHAEMNKPKDDDAQTAQTSATEQPKAG
jgi:hypothetical protein